MQETAEQIKRIQRQAGNSGITYGCPKCKDDGWIGYTGDDGYFYCRECECGIVSKKKMAGRLAFAAIPERYRTLVMADFDTRWYGNDQKDADAVKSVARGYLGNYYTLDGRGLYLYSNTKGNGKTRLACIIANELVKMGIIVKFATAGDILEEIKRSWDSNTEYGLMSDLKTAEVLVIDDFGTVSAKGWINEKFYQIINARYVSKRPTIFTSNCDLATLERMQYDQRITSRIKESCFMVMFPGSSLRDKKNAQNQMDMKGWLGVGR